MEAIMKTILTGVLAAATLVGGIAASTAPAQARGWGPGAVAAAGIVGLGVGAALAGPHYAYGPPGYYYGARYGYGPCHTSWRWNPYWGRYERVGVCY
jgi:hypothetical protein